MAAGLTLDLLAVHKVEACSEPIVRRTSVPQSPAALGEKENRRTFRLDELVRFGSGKGGEELTSL